MATGREIAKELTKRKDVLIEVFTEVLVNSGILKKKEVEVTVTKEVIKELTSEKEEQLNAKIKELEDNLQSTNEGYTTDAEKLKDEITQLKEDKANLEKDIEGKDLEIASWKTKFASLEEMNGPKANGAVKPDPSKGPEEEKKTPSNGDKPDTKKPEANQ